MFWTHVVVRVLTRDLCMPHEALMIRGAILLLCKNGVSEEAQKLDSNNRSMAMFLSKLCLTSTLFLMAGTCCNQDSRQQQEYHNTKMCLAGQAALIFGAIGNHLLRDLRFSARAAKSKDPDHKQRLIYEQLASGSSELNSLTSSCSSWSCKLQVRITRLVFYILTEDGLE